MIDREYLGMNLHTALRKACDSTPTSIAYNAVNLIDKIIWLDYLNHIWSYMAENPTLDNKSLPYLIKEASLDWDESLEAIKAIQNKNGTFGISTILKCSFKLFDEDDWFGYSYYLRDDE